jgi:hypothetical protein
LLDGIQEGRLLPADEGPKLPGLAAQTGLKPGKLQALYFGTYRAYLEQILADDLITAEDERNLDAIGAILRLHQHALAPRILGARREHHLLLQQ